MRKINRKIASAVLLSKDKKILFGLQRKGGVYDDCWHIPGGGMDEGETLEKTLIREVLEETGIDISKCSIELIDDTQSGEAKKIDKTTGEELLVNMSFNDFLVRLPKNANQYDINKTDDLVELKWFTLGEIDDLKLTPPSVKLFAKIRKENII